MARIRMVTRTIRTTHAVALIVDTEKATLGNGILSVSGEFENATDMLKAFQKKYDTSTRKVVSISAPEVIEELYGMTEEAFLSMADKLPPRKQYDTDTEEE